MHTNLPEPNEEDVLRLLVDKIPEASDWLSLIRFEYPDGKMEVVLNDLPVAIARKIMMAFNNESKG